MIFILFLIILMSMDYYTLEREIWAIFSYLLFVASVFNLDKAVDKNESSMGYLNIIYAMPYYVGIIEGTI